VKLAFYGHNNVEVFLGLDEVAKIRRDHILYLSVMVRVSTENWLCSADDVVGEIIVLNIADEVRLWLGLVARAHQTHLWLAKVDT
jgi:hypothetical protein